MLFAGCVAATGCDTEDGTDDGVADTGSMDGDDDDAEDDAPADEGEDDNTDADADADAGSEEGGDDEGGEPSFATDVAPIIAASCGCHTGAAPSAGLDLNDGAAYAALVGPDSSAGIPFVTPGDSAASYLVNKIEGTQADVGGSGGRMPVGGELASGDIDTIVAWVDAGAAE